MNGIELITKEREEQINKHGWDIQQDEKHGENQLLHAASYAISPNQTHPTIKCYSEWIDFTENIDRKTSTIERLKIAGALIAAEIDRLQRV